MPPSGQALGFHLHSYEARAVVPHPLPIGLNWALSRRAPHSRDRQSRGVSSTALDHRLDTAMVAPRSRREGAATKPPTTEEMSRTLLIFGSGRPIRTLLRRVSNAEQSQQQGGCRALPGCDHSRPDAIAPACDSGNGGDTSTVPIQFLALRSSRSAMDSASKSVDISTGKACPTIDCTLTTARRRSSISQSTAVSTPHLEQMIHCAVP